jgi:hypothetical protein
VNIDAELQAQVDAQLLEHGAFTPLDLLIDSGRLGIDDYEAWRRREIDFLEDALMGSRDKIREQIEAASHYARRIGLVEQPQEFYAWGSDAHGDKPLRISPDPQWHRLVAGRYIPAQDTPQMDLFFDNPVVALTNGLVRALSARNTNDAQRLLDHLYAKAPNHTDLAAFDRLVAASEHLNRPVDDTRQELELLRALTPVAKRLLGFQARNLLAPLWRQLADALEAGAYMADEPELHRSFALSQAQDWVGVSDSVIGESRWQLHPPLCLRLAQSAFHRRDRILALTAWFQLCWNAPMQAADALDHHRHADGGVTALWQRYVASVDDLPPQVGAPEYESAADFPAWLILHEPGLTQQLDADLGRGDTAAEEHFRSVHRWVEARRANRQDEEMALRKTLQAAHPALFHYLKRRITA